MSSEKDDFVVFKDDPAAAALAPDEGTPAVAPTSSGLHWRVLIVDDDADVHSATEFALSGLEILERPLQFLHAYSGAEAIEVLMSEDDIAVILLDVVMETEEAGLAAISTIRTDLGLTHTQIILRTGQPGYAPELETIRRYQINDYRTKSELSRVKIYTALTASIRTYEHLKRLDHARTGVELVVKTGAEMLAARSATAALEILLLRAAELLGVPPTGLLAGTGDDEGTLSVIAAVGDWKSATGQSLNEIAVPHGSLVQSRVAQSQNEGRSLIDPDGYTIHLAAGTAQTLIAYLPNVERAPLASRQLLDVFSANVAVCAENLTLVQRLKSFAFVDSLTGLASRRAFVDTLNQRLRGKPRSCTAVALIDIDQFAETNDMFGHEYGDEVLRGIGKRLRDSLPSEVFLARLAADSFALLGTPEQLAIPALRRTLALPFVFGGEERMISVSSSLVEAAEAEENADGNDLLKDASIVIKRGKAQGLGRHTSYTRQFREEARAHSRTLHELGNAFRRDELYLAYQPQIDLQTNSVIGVEALLRWRLPDGKHIPPDRFIPIAENSGLIKPIGNWVLTTATAAIVKMLDVGYPDLHVAVNVSPTQLATEDFLNHLDRTLTSSGLNPSCIELEVTESASVLGFEHLSAQLNGFRDRGVAIAIDDFGTGYSSLSYLDRLPVDRLKIDRAFVTALTDPKQGPRIAELVVPLGRSLGMKVLAEGVETEEQAQILTAMGCHEAQGYLYARPMQLDELLEWLSQRRSR
jgi:diguanylate cyclase (GGDEF)-like protein